MSTVAFIRKMIEAGFSHDDALKAAEVFEATVSDLEPRGDRTPRQERNRRYYEKRLKASYERLNASETSELDAPPLSLPPSPQTPQPPTHTPPDITTGARAATKPSILAKPNGFGRWWEAYPNKVGKVAAEKAYANACRKIGDGAPETLMLGLERALKSRPWSEGYIPHPATWLNQGRWDDQPAEITPSQSPMRRQDDQRPDPKRTAREANYARAFAGFEAVARSRS